MRWTVVLLLTVLLTPLVFGRDGSSGSFHKKREKHISKHKSQPNQLDSQKRFLVFAIQSIPKLVGQVIKGVPKFVKNIVSKFKKTPTVIPLPADPPKSLDGSGLTVDDEDSSSEDKKPSGDKTENIHSHKKHSRPKKHGHKKHSRPKKHGDKKYSRPKKHGHNKHHKHTNKDHDDTQAVKMCTMEGENEYCVWKEVVDSSASSSVS